MARRVLPSNRYATDTRSFEFEPLTNASSDPVLNALSDRGRPHGDSRIAPGRPTRARSEWSAAFAARAIPDLRTHGPWRAGEYSRTGGVRPTFERLLGRRESNTAATRIDGAEGLMVTQTATGRHSLRRQGKSATETNREVRAPGESGFVRHARAASLRGSPVRFASIRTEDSGLRSPPRSGEPTDRSKIANLQGWSYLAVKGQKPLGYGAFFFWRFAGQHDTEFGADARRAFDAHGPAHGFDQVLHDR